MKQKSTFKKSNKSQKRTKSRSRGKSIEKEKSERQKFDYKIEIPIYSDTTAKDPVSIKRYIDANKAKFDSGKLTLEDYLKNNDVDNEKLFEYLNKTFSDNIKQFYRFYQKEFYKLTIEQRKIFQNKMNVIGNIPNEIQYNYIEEKICIEDLFKKILLELTQIQVLKLENIQKIFFKNKVYFKNQIDLRIPYKYGSKELQFNSNLSDLYFYFQSSKKKIDDLFSVFIIMDDFIKNIEKNDANIILKSNYLINILYMFLDGGNLDRSLFMSIVKTCIPFNQKTANQAFNDLKNNLKKGITIIINDTPIKNYNKVITGNEKMILEYKPLKIKIEVLAKFINWDLHTELYTYLISEKYMLCVKFPENCKFNRYSDYLGEDVNNFFEHMLKSAAFRQAMVIDTEASKYKYFFDNDEILKEFNSNLHLVPLPFDNIYGYTDKKSFDIYINILPKGDNNFAKILKNYNMFFISKSHEFKHGTLIYLRIFDKKIGIKIPVKYMRYYNKVRAYIPKICDKTNKILQSISSKNNSKESIQLETSNDDYGYLFELSLFGYKYKYSYLKSIIFCLKESSWTLSPEAFYHQFTLKFFEDKLERADLLFKENFLSKLYKFYDFIKQEKEYGNDYFSKDANSYFSNSYYFKDERLSHTGWKDLIRGKTVEQIREMENFKEDKEKDDQYLIESEEDK